jgi:hypothetical protein
LTVAYFRDEWEKRDPFTVSPVRLYSAFSFPDDSPPAPD